MTTQIILSNRRQQLSNWKNQKHQLHRLWILYITCRRFSRKPYFCVCIIATRNCLVAWTGKEVSLKGAFAQLLKSKRIQSWNIIPNELCTWHMADNKSNFVADVEVDLDDLLANPFNSQPPSLDALQKLTGFQKSWLAFFYRNFKQVGNIKFEKKLRNISSSAQMAECIATSFEPFSVSSSKVSIKNNCIKIVGKQKTLTRRF